MPGLKVTVLRGEVEHQLDDRARAAIPKPWRPAFEHGAFLTRGWYGCLFLLPWGEWLKIEEKLVQIRITDTKGDMVRVFFSGGVETWLDGQGRIILPSSLRQYAGIDKDLVIRGVLNRVEIWGKERWLAFQTQEFAPERIMARAAELDI